MIIWEHKIVAWTEVARDRDIETERQDIVNKLDEISADGGWELIQLESVFSLGESNYGSIWKRPKQ